MGPPMVAIEHLLQLKYKHALELTTVAENLCELYSIFFYCELHTSNTCSHLDSTHMNYSLQTKIVQR